MASKTRKETIALLIVHGIGPFSHRDDVEREVSEHLRAQSINADLVTSFDWSSIVGDQAQKIAEVARAVFRLLYLRLPTNEAILPATWNTLRLYAYGTLQLLFLMLPLLSVTCFFEQIILQIWAGTSLVCCVVCAVTEFIVSGAKSLPRFIRQLALLVGWPIAHGLLLASHSEPEGIFLWAAKICVFFASWALIFGLGSAALRTGSAGDFFGALAVFSVLGAVFGVIAGVCVAAARPFLPLFKRYADVLLWLGDQEYRVKLRRLLTQRVRELLQSFDEVILVGHSLGSVLLIDSLMLIDVDMPSLFSKKIRLVTLGSPLKSLIYRYFPESFSAPSALCLKLLGRFDNFRWLNIFRPRDPIGTSLELRCGASSRDVATNQPELWGLKAHSGYWSDTMIWAIVARELQDPPKPVHDPSNEFAEPTLWIQDDRDAFAVVLQVFDNFRQLLSSLVRVVIFAAIPFFTLLSVLYFPTQHYRNIVRKGVEADGIISCGVAWHQPKLSAESGYYEPLLCTLQFEVQGKKALVVKKVDLSGLPTAVSTEFLLDAVNHFGSVSANGSAIVSYLPQKIVTDQTVVVQSAYLNFLGSALSVTDNPGASFWLRALCALVSSAFATVLMAPLLLSLTLFVKSLFGIDSE